tara:strand:- start:1995 stop:3395 length:1401 start_codon:yes stop_codon:yes gene_type:complete
MVNIDALLNEWAYRCEKGYPDMDSPSDLRVLKTILKEQKISLPEFYADGRVVGDLDDEELKDFVDNGLGTDEEILDAIKLVKTKEDEDRLINAHIASITCPYQKDTAMSIKRDPTLSAVQKIKKININCNFLTYDYVKSLLLLSGYKKNEAKSYSNEIQGLVVDVSNKDRDFFLKYVENPKKQIAFTPTPGKKGNLFDDIKETGIANNIIKKIVMHTTQDEGGRGVGMGELALSLIFKNVGAPVGKGDLSLDGEEFEIKGEGATLGARPDTVSVINLNNIAKFIKGEYGDKALGFKKEKRLTKKGTDKTETNLYFKGEKWTKNKFSEILADIYREADDKEAFKAALKQDLKDIDKVEKNKMSAAVDEYFDEIKFEKGELEIQRGIALMNAYRYILVEGFTRFLAHDFGAKATNKGDYVYCEGSGGDASANALAIVNQLKEAGATFEKISPGNLKPRIGFARSYAGE